MNELLLISIVIIILVGSQLFLSGIKNPALHYIRIIAGIILLGLVWVFNEDGNTGPRMLVSILAMTSIFKEVQSLWKLKNINLNK